MQVIMLRATLKLGLRKPLLPLLYSNNVPPQRGAVAQTKYAANMVNLDFSKIEEKNVRFTCIHGMCLEVRVCVWGGVLEDKNGQERD